MKSSEKVSSHIVNLALKIMTKVEVSFLRRNNIESKITEC